MNKCTGNDEATWLGDMLWCVWTADVKVEGKRVPAGEHSNAVSIGWFRTRQSQSQSQSVWVVLVEERLSGVLGLELLNIGCIYCSCRVVECCLSCTCSVLSFFLCLKSPQPPSPKARLDFESPSKPHRHRPVELVQLQQSRSLFCFWCALACNTASSVAGSDLYARISSTLPILQSLETEPPRGKQLCTPASTQRIASGIIPGT